MHYYQFNIGDYKSHTDHLDLLEDLAFRRMMDWCYLHEEPLPLDINEIAKKILMRTHTESIAYVLEEFFIKTDSGYINSRIKKEVDAFKAKSDKARKSAEARWNKKQPQSEGNANALQPQSEGNAKQETLNINQEPLTNKQETSNKKLSAKANNNEVLEVFNYWKEVMRKGASTRLNKKREKLISDRLKDGYPVEEVKQAIFNCSRSAFHMGQNDNQTKYNDIDLICRPDKFEQFRDNVGQQPQQRQFSQAAEKTINNIIDVELD